MAVQTLLAVATVAGALAQCPPAANNGGCCSTCEYNHFCPANGGCYSRAGLATCPGELCPAPGESTPVPPAPPAPAPTPGDACWGGKAGIAAHLNGDWDTDAVAASQISWNYNWAMQGVWKNCLEFFPQIHGAGHMGSIGNMQNSAVWMAFNEPNMNFDVGGTAMDVGQVVGFWPQIEQAAKQHGASILIGPSVANVNPDQWYRDFFSRCPNCRVDAIGFHAYSCDLQNMQNVVNKLRQFGRPLWLTEFACADNPNAIAGNYGGSKDWYWQCEYMKQVIPYLEGEDIISKFAWFSFNGPYAGQSNLVSGGRLTDLGNCYNNLVSIHGGKADIMVA